MSQAEQQLLPLLLTVNTSHFDYGASDFERSERVERGDAGASTEGAGRAAIGRATGCVRAFTLEVAS